MPNFIISSESFRRRKDSDSRAWYRAPDIRLTSVVFHLVRIQPGDTDLYFRNWYGFTPTSSFGITDTTQSRFACVIMTLSGHKVANVPGSILDLEVMFTEETFVTGRQQLRVLAYHSLYKLQLRQSQRLSFGYPPHLFHKTVCYLRQIFSLQCSAQETSQSFVAWQVLCRSQYLFLVCSCVGFYCGVCRYSAPAEHFSGCSGGFPDPAW